MDIKHIAAAVITPAAIAGVALSAGSAASAATVHHAAHGQDAVHGRDAARDKAHPQDKYHQWVTVRAGDSLSKIAAAHHMSWQALYMAPPNRTRIHDPNLLMVGERLRIPADPKLWASKYVAPQAPAGPAAAQAPAQGSTVQSAGGGSSQPTGGVSSQSSSGTSAQSASGSSSGPAGSSFQQCVAWRESGNNPTSPDGLYGILPSTWASLGYSGTAGQAPVAQQNAAFNQLYAKYGTQPWAPYDGC